jgi:hypothetical protein
LEENVRREKKNARELQESLNQEQKLRAELENRVKLQSQSLADLEQQRHTVQWRCTFLEDQLRQFLYVEPFIYSDSCNSETSGFGGLAVSMLASGTQDRGFAPGRSRWIFWVKNTSACLPSEGK